MATKKLEHLDKIEQQLRERLEQIKAQRAAAQARERARERARETRAKIVLGSALIALMRADARLAEYVRAQIARVVQERDLALVLELLTRQTDDSSALAREGQTSERQAETEPQSAA